MHVRVPSISLTDGSCWFAEPKIACSFYASSEPTEPEQILFAVLLG